MNYVSGTYKMIFKNKYSFREKAVVFVKNFSCEETNYNSEKLQYF